jgi:hypothetical protein
MGNDSERRAYRRYNVDAGVRIRAAGDDGPGVPCRLTDAGRGGVAVMLDEPPETDHIHVEILNTEGQPIGEALEAEVIHAEPSGDGAYRVGCRFQVPEEILPDEDE